MDYLLAKTKGKKGAIFKVLSDNAVYENLPDFNHITAKGYNDDYKLQDNEMFAVDDFSRKIYCIDFVKNEFVDVNYQFLNRNDYGKVEFLISLQDNGRFYLFQKITSRLVFKRYRAVTFFNEKPSLVNQENLLVINERPDAYYDKANDKLYFTRLSDITNVFPGINELYREATDDEVQGFSDGVDLVNFAVDFTKDKVKTANRRRIKEAQERYNSYTPDQKAALPGYILKYCHVLYENNFNPQANQFSVKDETELTTLLNALNQRYYTTEVSLEKKLATSVEDV